MPTACRFGSKADAVQLLQEWVQAIGSEAGLSPSNTSLSTGRRAVQCQDVRSCTPITCIGLLQLALSAKCTL